MPKISVLVPVYNVEKYLKECLNSIIHQTFKDMEIICMDDGSTDTSGKILDEYAKLDSRIKVIHKSNSGYGSTMNQAISMALGDYVGIVESDDTIDCNMYEVLYNIVQKYNLDFVKTDFYKTWDREDGSQIVSYISLTENEEVYNKVIKPNDMAESYFLEKFTWNALYRRDFLQKNNIKYNETAGASYQDNGFWFQTFYCADKVMFLNQAFYRYKQDNPLSSINSSGKVYAMKNEYDYIRKFLLDKQEKNILLYQITFHFRLMGYFFTFHRIAEKYKEEFAKTIVNECAHFEQLGEANYEWMQENEKNLLEELRIDAVKYVRDLLNVNQKIRKSVEAYSHIIIYGAGNYGKNTFYKLKRVQENNFKINVAVTYLENKKEYCLNNVVYEIKDFLDAKDTALVILAISKTSEAYEQMYQNLLNLGFKHIKHALEI